MNPLADFPITRRWPARHPDRLQLYTLGTPNGVKVSIALEEIGLPYEAHRVSFADNDQFTPEFLSLNPNNKGNYILDKSAMSPYLSNTQKVTGHDDQSHLSDLPRRSQGARAS